MKHILHLCLNNTEVRQELDKLAGDQVVITPSQAKAVNNAKQEEHYFFSPDNLHYAGGLAIWEVIFHPNTSAFNTEQVAKARALVRRAL